jgi:hypothetical protein
VVKRTQGESITGEVEISCRALVHDDQGRRRQLPRKLSEQFQGRRVGPVKVMKAHHRRASSGESVDHGSDRGEKPASVCLSID